jgi:hypothetical protein
MMLTHGIWYTNSCEIKTRLGSGQSGKKHDAWLCSFPPAESIVAQTWDPQYRVILYGSTKRNAQATGGRRVHERDGSYKSTPGESSEIPGERQV